MPAEYGEPLSPRELEITELVAQGLTNREVAAKLFLSHNTVKVHLRNIFTKTGVASRTELSMLAIQEGWISMPGQPVEEKPDDEPAIPVPEAPAVAPEADQDARVSWPWQRWVTVACGIALALGVFVLPHRFSAPSSAAGPGDVFGADTLAPDVIGQDTEDGWQELAPLPVRRAGMGAVAHDGKLYVVGGTAADDQPSARLDTYDTETDVWEERTARPAALAAVGAVAVDGRIWVPGGCDVDWRPSGRMDVYSTEDNTWRDAEPLPVPLCAYAIATDGEEVYVFGGWDGDSYRAMAFAYSPAVGQWRTLAAPRQARGYGAAAVLNGRVFYVGGYDGEREWATCEVYLPDSDNWDDCPSTLQPRGGLSMVSIGGRLYAIGGGWQTPLGFNERYTPATDQWTVLETPIVGEWRNLGAVPLETAIYTVGGWSGSGFLNRTYAVEVMPWRVFIPGTFRTP